MYSDTHFHFQKTTERARIDGAELLSRMAGLGCAFALDVGTECADLAPRRAAAAESIARVDESLRAKALSMLRLSAGVWPDAKAIRERDAQTRELSAQIKRDGRVAAVGECGLDHHWNPSGEDARDKADFDAAAMQGEAELFEAQLSIARALSLPVIVHSREAFDGTLSSVKNVGYDFGIIHCFSYGINEARAFLDRGWLIAFGGAVTYAKKSKMQAVEELLRYVPSDRIMVETDAPFLAPVPMRGQPNSPLFIPFTYEFIARARGESVESLCAHVDENCARLFPRSA